MLILLQYLSSKGTRFYGISLTNIVSQCLANPKVSLHLSRLPVHTDGCYMYVYSKYNCIIVIHMHFRELYHGMLWRTDPRFRAPMVNLVDGTSVFVRDCVSFHHPNLGNSTKGLVVEFFLEVHTEPLIIYAD